MRLPSLERDFWELASGEELHAQHPETFHLPTRENRDNLKRGDAAKLIFIIEGIEENGSTDQAGERIFVIVAEKVGDCYIGILDDQPALIEVTDETYLRFGAEIPFLAEHVIEIAEPPPKYVDWQLSIPPERIWPRD